jgi:UDP-N-acetyl-D-glucosamine dehydrogenase
MNPNASPADSAPATLSPAVLSPAVAALRESIAERTAVIGVIGQGYVGLPLALVFCEAGFSVLGLDLDPAKVAALSRGESYIKHIGPERVAKAVASGRFTASTDFYRLAGCEAVIICVPTPLGRHREPDLSFIRDTADVVAAHMHPGQLVVLESTTYPGTTEEELLPRFLARGLSTPDDFLLAFSPEREDPGNPSFSTRTIPKIVGGVNPESTEVAAALYSAALEQVVPVANAKVAEAAKLLENIYRSVNIALVNELKMTFEPMGVDIWDVIEAAKTKPFGFQAFYPGPGLGGHCIPLDPFYLTWKAAELGLWTRFIELAGEINTRMPAYVVNRTVEALNQEGKSIKDARVLVLGLSYKADIDDDRESPSYEILELLEERGAIISYCDPYFPRARAGRKHDMDLASVPLSAGEFARYDCLVLSTAHREFAEPSLYRDVALVVDARHMVSPEWGPRVVGA